MSAVLNIPPRHFAVGNYGPFASASVSVDKNGYGVTFTKGSDWPADGDVFTALVEVSLDGGKTWQEDAAITYSGGPWNLPHKGGQTNTVTWTVTGPPLGTTNIRASLNVLQAMTLGIAIATL
jgi:hypothetical protein